MTTDPIRKSVTVPLNAQAAFALFTAKINTWWPVESHSVSAGDGAPSRSLSFEGQEGGTLIEIAADGSRHVWGEVLEWDPGRAFAMTWHPGKMADQRTRLRVTFENEGSGCRVDLTHSGWEALSEGAEARKGYNSGWDGVLARFLEAA